MGEVLPGQPQSDRAHTAADFSSTNPGHTKQRHHGKRERAATEGIDETASSSTALPMKTVLIVLACVLWCSAAAAESSGSQQREGANPYVISIDTEPWINALRTDDLFVSDPAIESLAALGDHAIPALAAAMAAAKTTSQKTTSQGTQTRINIVEILSDIRTPATVPLLVQAAHDTSVEVRGDAVDALGRLGRADCRAAIEAALDDPAPQVAAKAAAACGRVCSSRAALRTLLEMSIRRQPASIASNARNSLRKLIARDTADRQQISELAEKIVVPVMNDTGASNRRLAALMAGTLGIPSALPVLRTCAIERVDTDPLTSVYCVQAIGDSRLDQAVAPLEEISKTDHPILTPTACKALAALAKTNSVARDSAMACARQRQAQAGGTTR